jgi:hypothetical protein
MQRFLNGCNSRVIRAFHPACENLADLVAQIVPIPASIECKTWVVAAYGFTPARRGQSPTSRVVPGFTRNALGIEQTRY